MGSEGKAEGGNYRVLKGCGKSTQGEVRVEVYSIGAEGLDVDYGAWEEEIPQGTRQQRQL